MFCDKCGKELAVDSLFCSKCGNKVQLAANSEESWICEGCEQKFETESKAVEHEKNCQQYLESKNLIETPFVEEKENTVFEEIELRKNLNWVFLISIILYLSFVISRFTVFWGFLFFIVCIIGILWIWWDKELESTFEEPNVTHFSWVSSKRTLFKYIFCPLDENSRSNIILFYGAFGCSFLLLSLISSWFVYDMGYQYYDNTQDYPDNGYYSDNDPDHEGNHGLAYSFNLDGISVYINTEREWEGYWDESYWLNTYRVMVTETDGYHNYPIYSNSSYQELNGFEDVQDLTKIVKYLVWGSIVLWMFTIFVCHYKMRRFLETTEIRKKIESLSNSITRLNLKLSTENETDKALLPTSAITAKIDKAKIRPYVVVASPKKILSGLMILTFISLFLALSAALYFETSFISMIHNEDELVITEDSYFSAYTSEIRVNGVDRENTVYGWTFEWGRGYGIYFIYMGIFSYLGLVYNSIALMRLEKKEVGDIEEMFDNLFI